MSFAAPLFTNAGKALQMRALGGESLIFTTIKIGDGQTTAAQISGLTALVNPLVSMSITSAVRTDKYFSIKGAFTNQALKSGFFWRELGVYAADPDYPDDRSKDILYCYQNAYNLAEYIASGGSEIVEKIVRLNMFVGNAESVSATIDSSTIFLTQSDLENYYTKDYIDLNLTRFVDISAIALNQLIQSGKARRDVVYAVSDGDGWNGGGSSE